MRGKGSLRRARWFALGLAAGGVLAAAGAAYLRPASSHAAAASATTSIVRLRTTKAVKVPPGTPPSVPPVFDPSVSKPWHWTQQANAIYLAVGAVTVQTPSSCTTTGGQLPDLTFFVRIDGQTHGAFDVNQLPAGTTQSVNIGEIQLSDLGGHFLFESPTTQSHTLDFQVQSNCIGSGQTWVVKSVGIDFVATG